VSLQTCFATVEDPRVEIQQDLRDPEAFAAQIIDQEGGYALALKKNQGTLYHEVKETRCFR